MPQDDREVGPDAPPLQRMAWLFQGVAAESRLAVLVGLLEGESMPAVADDLGVSRSAIQGHLDHLMQRRMVYRPETGEKTYRLTPLGLFFAVFIRENQDLLLEIMDLIEETEDAVADDLSDVPVSDETRERMVAEETYDRVADEVEELLRGLAVAVPDEVGNGDSSDDNTPE